MLDKIKFLTAGESHGKALVGIIDGIPSGLEIGSDYIQMHMAHRQLGYGRGGRMKIEDDNAKILSGIRHGYSIGSPISLWIENKDFNNWSDAMSSKEVDEEVDIKKQTKVVDGWHNKIPKGFEYVQSTSQAFYFFENIPDKWTWLGIVIIIGSGIYILVRKKIIKNVR